MSFDPTKPQPWDIYSYKVRPGYTGDSTPIERDVLHAQSLGIIWTQTDTDLCEAQAEQGRAFATSAAVIEKPSCDCGGQCAKCNGEKSESFYRPQGARTGRFNNATSGLAEYDAIVCREEGFYVIVPQSIRAREWFSIHYAERQTASGRFLFQLDSDIIQLATRARDEGLSFGKGY